MNTDLDEFDIKILSLVQQNNRLSAEQMAGQVPLSPSAIQRRLKRLRASGVIEADVSIVAPEAVGRSLTAIVEVTMMDGRTASSEDFRRLMVNAREVMQCYKVTGDADFIVIMTAKNIEQFGALAQKFFSDNPGVRRWRTSLVIKRVKLGLAVPLEEESAPPRR